MKHSIARMSFLISIVCSGLLTMPSSLPPIYEESKETASGEIMTLKLVPFEEKQDDFARAQCSQDDSFAERIAQAKSLIAPHSPRSHNQSRNALASMAALAQSPPQGAPPLQYMCDDMQRTNCMKELLHERIALARKHTAHDQGLFKNGDSTVQSRCADMCAFSSQCYRDIMINNNLTWMQFWASLIPGMLLGCVYDIASSVVQCPCATAYVCCNAHCARRCYRDRYETNVLYRYGLEERCSVRNINCGCCSCEVPVCGACDNTV